MSESSLDVERTPPPARERTAQVCEREEIVDEAESAQARPDIGVPEQVAGKHRNDRLSSSPQRSLGNMKSSRSIGLVTR